MKLVKCLAILATLTLGLSLSAFAKDKNQGKFVLSDEAQVGSTQLKPGEYKVQWDGSGDAVQVKILQGKNVVATTTAKLVEQRNAAQADAVTLDTGGNMKTLKEIDFGNRKEALVFTGNQGSPGQ
jgi:hypothetical protein